MKSKSDAYLLNSDLLPSTPILYSLLPGGGGHRLTKKRSPKNKITDDSDQLLCLTSAPQLLSVSWLLCYAFWSLVWFVANRWINRLLWGTTETAASGKNIRKSVAGPVNKAACPSVICWLSAVTLKCPVPIWPELSCCLWDYQSACPLSTWKLGKGTWPSCFPLSGSSECLLALLCLVSLAVNSTQSGVGCFWEGSTWLLRMGKEKEWNQDCQICLQGSGILLWMRVALWILESTSLWGQLQAFDFKVEVLKCLLIVHDPCANICHPSIYIHMHICTHAEN